MMGKREGSHQWQGRSTIYSKKKSQLFISWAFSDFALDRSVSLRWYPHSHFCCTVHSGKLEGEMVMLLVPLS